jgi:hypothetical protein
MGFSARSLALALPLVFVLAPSIAVAQGAGTGTAAPPPPPGGGAAAPAPAGTDKPAPAADEKKGEVGGFSFNDKPAVRRGQQTTARRVVRRAGPLATFPGFEQLPDGGSRLFVQLSQTVPVEERRAQGSVTYVLKGAHLRVNNDANALVTVHFNTPVFRARLTPSGNDLLFVLELRSAATPAFKVQDNQDKTSTLMIDFAKGDFITGDSSELLPGEQRPARGTRRSGKGGTKGAEGAPGGRQPPPEPDNAAPSGNTGPTP